MKHSKFICLCMVLVLLIGCSTSSKGMNKETISQDLDSKSVQKPNITIKEDGIDLANDFLSISMNPKTLEVMNKDQSGNEVKLSDSVGNYNISKIKQTDEGVRFTLLDEGVDVGVSLSGNQFNIEFNTQKEKHFTWPKVDSTQGFDAYILPHHEGKYIPKKDQTFIKYFTKYDSWDTLEFLSMPFLGIYNSSNTYTYIMKNGYNNDIAFNEEQGHLGFKIDHEFTSNHKEKQFSYTIEIGESDYIEPAKIFRKYLMDTDQFVSLEEKAKNNEEVKKLYGAIQVYLWSSGVLDKRDIKNWLGFVKNINDHKEDHTIGERIWNSLEDESKDLIKKYSKAGYVDDYGRKTLIRDMNQILKEKDFYRQEYFTNLKKSKELQTLISKGMDQLTDTQIYRLNLLCFYESYKDYFAVNVEDVGNAFSTKMLKELDKLGIHKAWLGGDNMAQNWKLNESFAKKAVESGYLIGSYDSYHSMHKPGQVKWDTAAFDDALWEKGGIMRKDGTYIGGFKQVGRKVSPLVAMPYVQNRMSKIMDSIKVNSWFVDCDAAGELYEDYNPLHPASEEDDANKRKERLQWMIDQYHMVVGSEGGSWYLADTLHFAQGMMTPVIAWDDKDMRQNKESKYYLGKYWPTEGPETFVKQVPLKDEYEYIYFNPKFRLPLYQTVYHDSLVTTSHWGSSSLKFTNEITTNALTELLYNVPPLYNLNLEELDKHGSFISQFYNAFSTMHEITATVPLNKFEILSEDRLVQKTKFSDKVEVIANYKKDKFNYEGRMIPPKSVEIFLVKENKRYVYSPQN